MKRGYHLCAFSNRRGNSFDRSRAHVTDGEYARQAGFEWPVDVGARAREARLGKIIGAWIGSLDERKQCYCLFKYRQLSQVVSEFGIGWRSSG